MQDSTERQARQMYERAQRLGQRQAAAAIARGERGTVIVLDEVAEGTQIMGYVRQPTREIPLERIVGTYTSARALSFSPGFMPLHQEGTEFAGKWTALCAAHMSEGLRDPIQVYEYLWNYYVVEGNKRVSVLRFFEAPTIRAEITRLLPQLNPDDPQTQTYYAFLQYDKQGLFKNIRLSSPQRYTQLAEVEQRLKEEQPEGQDTPSYDSMYLNFAMAYAKAGSNLPQGDAFLEYLKVYGFIMMEPQSLLVERIGRLAPQLVLAENPEKEPTLVMDIAEEPQPSLVSRLFGGKKTANVLFCYAEGRTENNWIGAHEKGRLEMQDELEDSVTSEVLDGLTPENAYDMLTEHGKGKDLVLVTASSLSKGALRFSLENPNTVTLVYSRVRQDARLHTYFGRYYEPVFLCGVAAGLATESGKVAYITPKLAVGTRHTSDINAFGLGVKSVRPGADVYLITRDVAAEDPTTNANGIKHAVALGCDVAQVPDYPGLSMVGPPDWSFTFLLRLHDLGAPSEYLASPAWNWGRFYTEIVKSFLNNSLEVLRYIDKREPATSGFWWGLGTGILEFRSTSFVHPIANNLLQYLRSSIQLGRFNPFHGPITDHDGTLRVPMHGDPKPYDILNMDWVADFIHLVD